MPLGAAIVPVMVDQRCTLWAGSIHFKFQSWCLKKASSPSWRRWRGIAVETWCRGADCESLMLWGLVQVQNCDAVVVNCGNATDAGKWHHGDLGHIKKKKNPLNSPKIQPAIWIAQVLPQWFGWWLFSSHGIKKCPGPLSLLAVSFLNSLFSKLCWIDYRHFIYFIS